MTVKYHLIGGLIEFLIGLIGILLVGKRQERLFGVTLLFVLMGLGIGHLIIAVVLAIFGTPE